MANPAPLDRHQDSCRSMNQAEEFWNSLQVLYWLLQVVKKVPTSPTCSCQGLHPAGLTKPRQVCPWTWGLCPAQGVHLLLSHLWFSQRWSWAHIPGTHVDRSTDMLRGGTHRILKWLVTLAATGKTMPSTSPKERNHIKHKYRQVSPLLLLGWKKQDVTCAVHTRYPPSLQAYTHLHVLQVLPHPLCSSIVSACILDPLYGPLAPWLFQLSAL